MKLNNAINKLKKIGDTNITDYNTLKCVFKDKRGLTQIIESHITRDNQIHTINLRDVKDVSDPMHDYSAGIFLDSVGQCIRFLKSSNYI